MHIIVLPTDLSNSDDDYDRHGALEEFTGSHKGIGTVSHSLPSKDIDGEEGQFDIGATRNVKSALRCLPSTYNIYEFVLHFVVWFFTPQGTVELHSVPTKYCIESENRAYDTHLLKRNNAFAVVVPTRLVFLLLWLPISAAHKTKTDVQ